MGAKKDGLTNPVQEKLVEQLRAGKLPAKTLRNLKARARGAGTREGQEYARAVLKAAGVSWLDE